MAASLVGHKDQLIDLKMFFVRYPVCVISVAILLAIVERCIILFFKTLSFDHRSGQDIHRNFFPCNILYVLKQTPRNRKEIVQYFVSQLIILINYCSFPHYCEQRYHLLAWVDNEIENTEICMKLFSWT